ncbi:hypothetical protein L9F63_004347, partial [Diploptera punctata]
NHFHSRSCYDDLEEDFRAAGHDTSKQAQNRNGPMILTTQRLNKSKSTKPDYDVN